METWFDPPLPSPGCTEVRYQSDRIETEDEFALYFLIDGEWHRHLKPWVRRIQEENELRADVIAFLSEAGPEGLALVERIRKVHW
jgi:hypothetical protein